MILKEVLPKISADLKKGPIYLYDESVIRQKAFQLKCFKQDLEKYGIFSTMHYSTKANANIEILKIIKEAGILIDAMSPGELKAVEAAGYKEKEILYVANNISSEEMSMVVNKNILICLDSISQIEMLGRTCPGAKFMARINPSVEGVGHSEKVITSGINTKFGIEKKDFKALKETVKKYNLQLIGLHQHLGSSFLNDKMDKYIEAVKIFLHIVKEFEDIKIVDLGGGFGVPYTSEERVLDLKLLVYKLGPVLKKFQEDYGIVELKFEPGRFLIAESSILLGTVYSIKKNSIGTTFVGTDIGMNVFVRPSMYDAYHKIEFIKKDSTLCSSINDCIVTGNVCESGDKLCPKRIINKDVPSNAPNLEIGDIVIVYDTGAYGYSMAYQYTGRALPQEVLITSNYDLKTIRKRKEYNITID